MGFIQSSVVSTLLASVLLLGTLQTAETGSPCTTGVTLNATTTRQNITSLNYPNPYPRPLSCQWQILAPSNHVIKFWVVHFDVFQSPTCYIDGFKINDGPNYMHSVYAEWCGTKSPQSLTVSGDAALVRFAAYGTGRPAPGFVVQYWAVSKPPTVVLQARYTVVNIVLGVISSVVIITLVIALLVIVAVRCHCCSRRYRRRYNSIYDASF